MKDDWIYWKIGLPEHSEALSDLDDLCDTTGLSRAEVSRLIVLTWSAARRGKVQEMWGFNASIALTNASTLAPETMSQAKQLPAETPLPKQRAARPAAKAAAAALDLD